MNAQRHPVGAEAGRQRDRGLAGQVEHRVEGNEPRGLREGGQRRLAVAALGSNRGGRDARRQQHVAVLPQRRDPLRRPRPFGEHRVAAALGNDRPSEPRELPRRGLGQLRLRQLHVALIRRPQVGLHELQADEAVVGVAFDHLVSELVEQPRGSLPGEPLVARQGCDTPSGTFLETATRSGRSGTRQRGLVEAAARRRRRVHIAGSRALDRVEQQSAVGDRPRERPVDAEPDRILAAWLRRGPAAGRLHPDEPTAGRRDPD